MTSVGVSHPRPDGLAKASGETVFAFDYEEIGNAARSPPSFAGAFGTNCPD